MLSSIRHALRKQRKGGPENGTETRPEIGPAGQFHRQCVEPLGCPDCGVYRRFIFLPSEEQETLALARQSMLSSIRPVLKHHTVNLTSQLERYSVVATCGWVRTT